jgi:hypothetical protein
MEDEIARAAAAAGGQPAPRGRKRRKEKGRGGRLAQEEEEDSGAGTQRSRPAGRMEEQEPGSQGDTDPSRRAGERRDSEERAGSEKGTPPPPPDASDSGGAAGGLWPAVSRGLGEAGRRGDEWSAEELEELAAVQVCRACCCRVRGAAEQPGAEPGAVLHARRESRMRMYCAGADARRGAALQMGPLSDRTQDASLRRRAVAQGDTQ